MHLETVKLHLHRYFWSCQSRFQVDFVSLNTSHCYHTVSLLTAITTQQEWPCYIFRCSVWIFLLNHCRLFLAFADSVAVDRCSCWSSSGHFTSHSESSWLQPGHGSAHRSVLNEDVRWNSFGCHCWRNICAGTKLFNSDWTYMQLLFISRVLSLSHLTDG